MNLRLLDRFAFRTSDHYELVVHDRLRDDERRLFAELASSPGHWGVLRPTGEGRTYKAVDRDTALLLFTLRRPGPLPRYLEDHPRAADRVRALVADGVLEVRTASPPTAEPDEETPFVGGAAGLSLLTGAAAGATDHAPAVDPDSLSIRALRHVLELELDDPAEAEDRLYRFHAEPAAPRWFRRYPDAEAVLGHHGLATGGPRAAALRATFTGPTVREAWISWHRRGEPADPDPTRPGWKLYVSVPIAYLDAALDAVVSVLPASRASQWKLGAHAGQLLRADKLVLYFTDFRHLQACAGDVANALTGSGIKGHGVPFTAAIETEADDAGGTLSWGMDPPHDQRPLSWQPEHSWRSWVASRLGQALVAARQADAPDAPDGPSPWCQALARLRLDGVDVAGWRPAPGLWTTADD